MHSFLRKSQLSERFIRPTVGCSRSARNVKSFSICNRQTLRSSAMFSEQKYNHIAKAGKFLEAVYRLHYGASNDYTTITKFKAIHVRASFGKPPKKLVSGNILKQSTAVNSRLKTGIFFIVHGANRRNILTFSLRASDESTIIFMANRE